MIARAEASRLLSAYLDVLADHPGADSWADLWETLAGAAETFLRESDLVIRGQESVEQKARRLIEEGRLTITAMRADETIIAECRGTEQVHKLGWNGRERRWGCTCPARGRCSHLAALQLVTTRPGGNG